MVGHAYFDQEKNKLWCQWVRLTKRSSIEVVYIFIFKKK